MRVNTSFLLLDYGFHLFDLLFVLLLLLLKWLQYLKLILNPVVQFINNLLHQSPVSNGELS